MGSCVSLHRDPDSAMKLRLSIGSKSEKILIPSPVKEKSDTVSVENRTIADVAPNSASRRLGKGSIGSKDEAFFDTQPWLESDGEDDFFSVNGDSTPSRGSTPVHHKFSSGNIQMPNKPSPVQEVITTISSPDQPSPQEKKKRLSELFKESLREHYDEQTAANKSTSETPYLSGANSVASSERTPNTFLRGDDKSSKSVQCCLPRLLSSRSSNEKRLTMSPLHTAA